MKMPLVFLLTLAFGPYLGEAVLMVGANGHTFGYFSKVPLWHKKSTVFFTSIKRSVVECQRACIVECQCEGYLWEKFRAQCQLLSDSKCPNTDVLNCMEPHEDYLERERQETCADMKLSNCADDGTYKLNLASKPWPSSEIYCLNMASSSPMEYVTLPTPSLFKVAVALGVDSSASRCVWTAFNKVKIDPTTLSVIRDDYTFTEDRTPTGLVNPTLPIARYGDVSGCSEYPSCGATGRQSMGYFFIDTSNTSFSISLSLILESGNWRPYLVECDSDGDFNFTDVQCPESSTDINDRIFRVGLKSVTRRLEIWIDGNCGSLEVHKDIKLTII